MLGRQSVARHDHEAAGLGRDHPACGVEVFGRKHDPAAAVKKQHDGEISRCIFGAIDKAFDRAIITRNLSGHDRHIDGWNGRHAAPKRAETLPLQIDIVGRGAALREVVEEVLGLGSDVHHRTF